MRARFFLLSTALLLVIVLLVRGQVRSGLSEHWGGTAVHRAASVEIVRSVLRGGPVPEEAAATLGTARPRRVYVTVHHRGEWARGEGAGATFVDSLVLAAKGIPRPVPAGAFVKVDVVTAERRLASVEAKELESHFETGIDGIRAVLGTSGGFALPSDMTTEGWFSPRRPQTGRDRTGNWFTRGLEGEVVAAKARERLANRMGRALGADDPVTYFRFRTAAFLARVDGGEPVELYRGMPVETERPSPEEIHDAALVAGEWLVKQLEPDGRFVYLFYPNRSGEQAAPRNAGYSTIRHTACAWMLYKIGRRFEKPEWIEAGRKAIRWLDPHLLPVHENGETRWIVAAPGEARGGLGHNAMAVIALAEMKDDLSPEEIAKLKGLGRSLERMFRPDGGFYENEHEVQRRPKNKQDELLYEHGEGFLALVMLAEAFPEETHWLESAKTTARYQIAKFHGKNPSRGKRGKPWYMPRQQYALYLVDQIHWQTQALDKLHALTRDDRHGRAAIEMGQAILTSGTPPMTVMLTPEGYPIGPTPRDYIGGFPLPGRVPRTTPTGSRAEALNAALRVQRRMGEDTKKFESGLIRIAGFQLRNQYDATSCYWCAEPERAIGAFRAGLTDNEVRIDFIQHVVAGMADTLEWYGATDDRS